MDTGWQKEVIFSSKVSLCVLMPCPGRGDHDKMNSVVFFWMFCFRVFFFFVLFLEGEEDLGEELGEGKIRSKFFV